MLPVIANCSIYIVLIYLRTVRDKNKVGIDGIVIEDAISVKVQTHCAPALKDNQDSYHKNGEQAMATMQRSSTQDSLSNVNSKSSTSSNCFENKHCILNSDAEIGTQVLARKKLLHIQEENSLFQDLSAKHLTGPSHLIINLPLHIDPCPFQSVEIISKDQDIIDHSIGIENLNPENLELTKIRNEKESAIRSLKTNLVLIFILFFVCILFLFPPKNWQFFLTALNESVQKSTLPILTTMANFLPIQSIIWQYILYLKTLFFKEE